MTMLILLVIVFAVDLDGFVAKLSNSRAEMRANAYTHVEQARRRLLDELRDQLKVVLANRDTRRLGRTDTVLDAIAAVRAENVVPQLVKAADFALDPNTFPVGARFTVSAYYPVARALRALGNRAVIKEVISAAAQDREDNVLRVYAWILIEVIGQDAARVMAEDAKVGRPSAEQIHLARLQERLEQGRSLRIPARIRKGNVAIIQNKDSPEPDGASCDGVPALSSEDEVKRDGAFIDVDRHRQRLEDELREQLRAVLADRDKSYLGRTHTVLQAIAVCRADNVVPELIEAVDFTLDPSTFPVGDRRATSSYYPVAETLRTIGNQAVIKDILSAAADKQPNEKALRIYAWTLIEVVGKDAAKVVVERGKIGRQPRQQRGILRLLKMVDEGGPLKMPPPMPLGQQKPPLTK